MRRREFIALLGAAATWPHMAHAENAAMPVVGILHMGSAATDIDAAFDRSLAERGYVFGKNVTKEARWAQGDYGRLAELTKELASLNPALIVAAGNVVALAARRATSTVPIVFIIASDPVKIGLVKSFAQPRGNATGISMLTAA